MDCVPLIKKTAGSSKYQTKLLKINKLTSSDGCESLNDCLKMCNHWNSANARATRNYHQECDAIIPVNSKISVFVSMKGVYKTAIFQNKVHFAMLAAGQ